MEIKPATVEQIAIFKKAAAAQYKARGIDPKKADALFNAQMAKMANEIGIKPVVDTAKIDKVASVIAKSVGRQRKA